MFCSSGRLNILDQTPTSAPLQPSVDRFAEQSPRSRRCWGPRCLWTSCWKAWLQIKSFLPKIRGKGWNRYGTLKRTLRVCRHTLTFRILLSSRGPTPTFTTSDFPQRRAKLLSFQRKRLDSSLLSRYSASRNPSSPSRGAGASGHNPHHPTPRAQRGSNSSAAVSAVCSTVKRKTTSL